jgi:hypothetical protein
LQVQDFLLLVFNQTPFSVCLECKGKCAATETAQEDGQHYVPPLELKLGVPICLRVIDLDVILVVFLGDVTIVLQVVLKEKLISILQRNFWGA